MTVLSWLIGLLTAALAVTSLTLLAQVLAAGLRPAQYPVAPRPRDGKRTVVLIPAHNESAGIVDTLASVRAQLACDDRILVVADNCNDDTADQARRAGAQAIERHDTSQRGKGYALAFGVAHLADNPPDVVVIVDADCTLADQALGRLVDQCLSSGRPVQARYLMRYPPGAGGLAASIAEFAFLVKNWVRPLGSTRLGAGCPLFGSGMAFPWSLIAHAPLANGNIVEDMKLGVDMTLAGHPVQFCEQARVDSMFPASRQGQATQRTRWEHGHLHTLINEVPRLLARGLRQRDLASLGLGLDLAIAPLSLHIMLLIAGVAVSSLAWLGGGAAWPAQAAWLGLVATALAVASAWRRHARQLLPLSALAAVPAYMLRKLLVYGRFLVARQTTWVRSRRDRE